MRPTLLVLALLLASTSAQADKVYKWTDAQGNVLYTDQPRPGAREILDAGPRLLSADLSTCPSIHEPASPSR